MKNKRALFVSIFLIYVGSIDVVIGSLKYGKELFDDGDYSDAAVELFKVYSSKSYKQDRTKAEWMLAESFENLSLFYSSSMFLLKCSISIEINVVSDTVPVEDCQVLSLSLSN